MRGGARSERECERGKEGAVLGCSAMAEAEQDEQDEEEQALMILQKPCEHQKRPRRRRKIAISALRLPPPQVVEEVHESGEGV